MEPVERNLDIYHPVCSVDGTSNENATMIYMTMFKVLENWRLSLPQSILNISTYAVEAWQKQIVYLSLPLILQECVSSGFVSVIPSSYLSTPIEKTTSGRFNRHSTSSQQQLAVRTKVNWPLWRKCNGVIMKVRAQDREGPMVGQSEANPAAAFIEAAWNSPEPRKPAATGTR